MLWPTDDPFLSIFPPMFGVCALCVSDFCPLIPELFFYCSNFACKHIYLDERHTVSVMRKIQVYKCYFLGNMDMSIADKHSVLIKHFFTITFLLHLLTPHLNFLQYSWSESELKPRARISQLSVFEWCLIFFFFNKPQNCCTIFFFQWSLLSFLVNTS